MNRKHIAVIFGGCSPEHGVSLASAAGILQHLDRSRFLPVLIGITKQGDWYLFEGDVSRVADGSWERGRCTPACLSPNRGRHELLVFRETGVAHIPIDAAFPVLHGRNGEDGTVQGLCELAGIPLAGCGTLASALCMDKDRAHKLVSLSGVRVPNSCVLHTGDDAQFAEKAAEALGYPLFVKPVKAGSSFGVARITAPDALGSAVEAAFYYDDRVLLEEAIPGFEVGCAVMGGDQLTLGEPDEIELAGGFFDYTEKYNLITSKIHVPARIPPEKAAEIKAAARTIYRALDCRGFARVDMFLTPDGEIVFNEVNTIPGFTSHSRFPLMMQAAGMSFDAVIARIIDAALEA